MAFVVRPLARVKSLSYTQSLHERATRTLADRNTLCKHNHHLYNIGRSAFAGCCPAMALRAALCLTWAASAAAHRGARVPRDLGERYFVNRLAVETPAKTLTIPEVTDHVIMLEKGNGSSLSSMYVNAIREQAAGENGIYSRLQVRFFTLILSIRLIKVFFRPAM